MIVLLFLSLLFARVAYLKQTAAAHRGLVDELVRAISPVEGVSIAEIQDEVVMLAEPGVRIRVLQLPIAGSAESTTVLENKTGFGHVVSPNDARQWREAIFHEVMVKRYESAMYRPWTLISESDAR
jgi:hypothetical protein